MSPGCPEEVGCSFRTLVGLEVPQRESEDSISGSDVGSEVTASGGVIREEGPTGWEVAPQSVWDGWGPSTRDVGEGPGGTGL